MTRTRIRGLLAWGIAWLCVAGLSGLEAGAQTIIYDIDQITTNGAGPDQFDSRPTLADNGDMAWVHNFNEIWFYDYSTDTITPIAGPATATASPAINNLGVVAYSSGGDIYLYDSVSGVTTPLTNDPTVSGSPKINDNGDVAYVNQGAGSADDYEILLYVASSGMTVNVSNDAVWQRQFDLNDEGDVVFLRGNGCPSSVGCTEGPETEVWLYDRSAGTRTRITTNSIAELSPNLNNLGDMGWQTFTVNFVSGAIENEVYFRDGSSGTATPLTDSSVRNQSLAIGQRPFNDAGDFAMMAAGSDGVVTDIYAWDAASASEVPIATYNGGQPVNAEPVNNSDGWVAWADQGEIFLAVPRDCVPEICDGLDNDCNGEVDDGIADIESGTDVGECQVEIQSCIDGSFQVIQTGVGPTSETCDGLDNDCNDATDDGIVDLQSGTDVGECQVEIQSCIGGAFQIVQPGIGPSAETCDGLDNDCNGTSDDGISDVQSGTDVGECQVEIQSCVGGDFQIVQPGIGPVAELCDGLDNDCNGVDDVTQGVCNTPPSSGPTTFTDPSGSASVEFPDVVSGGDTTIQEVACNVNTPDGYTLNTSASCYEITSDAESSTGRKTVCIRYPNDLVPAPTAVLKCESAGAQNCCAVALNGTINTCTDGTEFVSLGVAPPPPENEFQVCISVLSFSDFAFAQLDAGLDSDFDAVPDVSDNCPNDFNPLQEDEDLDGLGDFCDNCVFAANGASGGTCTAGDASLLGRGCAEDVDCGGSGFCSQGQQDVNADGVGDACDPAIVPFYASEVLETPACFFTADCTPDDFPLDWGVLRSFRFGVPPGEPIYNGVIKGTWGGSTFDSSAAAEIFLEGFPIIECQEPEPCWQSGSTVDWNEGRGLLLSNLGIDFSDPAVRALFEDGEAELSFVQNDLISLHVSNLELELFVPEPALPTGLLAGGLAMLVAHGSRRERRRLAANGRAEVTR